MKGVRDSLSMLLPDRDALEYSPVPGGLIVSLGTVYSRAPETNQKIRYIEHSEVHDIQASRVRQPKRRGVVQARKDQ